MYGQTIWKSSGKSSGTLNKISGKKFRLFCLFLMILCTVPGILGCGEKEESKDELVLGNWTQYRNRAYILLIINPKGIWDSSVRIADATSKIVSSKGSANGSWHMEEGQLIFTVLESDIPKIWEQNDTRFFEIVELSDGLMLLKGESGRIGEWKKTRGKKSAADQGVAAQVLSLEPFAVNLNKNSSNAKGRYLCLNMHLVFKELMPDQEIPKLHPKARDAAILFLSALVYGDVETFEQIKLQKAKLVDVLNPYMEGFIKDIEIEHVIIASSVAKVEEFIIEHTLGKVEETAPEVETGDDEKVGNEKEES